MDFVMIFRNLHVQARLLTSGPVLRVLLDLNLEGASLCRSGRGDRERSALLAAARRLALTL